MKPAAHAALRPRAAIYARFSTDLQNPRSAEDQARACREYADRQGWDVVEVYKDLAISGTTTARPGLNQLLADVEAGHFQIVVAEALDRVARDLGDTDAIYKRLTFADCALHTLSEGPIGMLHVGMAGTMNALFVKELANKIRRGQRGTVERGLVPGGMCYGYRAVPKIVDGVIERGHREIVPAEAAIIRRIFAETIAGDSPIAIVRRLNAERVPAPRGEMWRPTTLTGTRGRRNGILHNPAYAGQIAYNRVQMRKNPETRRRVSRANDADSVVMVPAEHLRIVDQASWDAVQKAHAENEGVPAHRQRRPKHVFSGLVRCGECGGAYTVLSKDRWGCGDRKAGSSCTNGRRVSTERLEQRVLAGLQRKLLAPDVVAAVVKRYHEHAAEEEKRMAGDMHSARERIAQLKGEIGRLVDAMASGEIDIAMLKQGLDTRKDQLAASEAELAEHEALRPIVLHPQIVESYRRRIALLGTALATGNRARQFLPVIRSLIGNVIVSDAPAEPDKAMIEVTGSLASVLALATGKPAPTQHKRTVSVVADEGLEPPTRGL